MAQQTRNKSNRSSSGNRSSSSSNATKRRSSTKSGASRSTNGSAAKRRSSSRSRSSQSGSAADKGALGTARDATVKGATTAKEATVKGAGNATGAVTSVAKQVKTPAMVAGAGIAGVAGGLALAHNRGRKVLGVKLGSRSTPHQASKTLASAARSVGAFAEDAGRIAERARLASEALSDGQTRRRRSPVEVVLEGLTTRRSNSAP